MLECYQKIQQVDKLKKELPPKPYCTDDLNRGLKIRTRATALKKRYIQLNPPYQKRFITFDLDYDTWAYVAEDFDLPQPIWCVGNTKNGHAHLIYALWHPVYTTSAAHVKPLRYLAAIEAAMTRKLEADPMYSGLISKNPWSSEWLVYQTGNMLYDLAFLAEYLPDLEVKLLKKPVGEIAGLGRNCFIFEAVRVWSYREVRRYWGTHKCVSSWFDAVERRCAEENANFSEPLYEMEVRCISRSIARWTWQHMSPTGFSDWQRRNIARRWDRESRKSMGLELLSEGLTVVEVAELLGVTERTCYNWKSQFPEERKIILPEEYRGTEGREKLIDTEGISLATFYRRQHEEEPRPEPLSESKPWEAEGISKATWYRRKT